MVVRKLKKLSEIFLRKKIAVRDHTKSVRSIRFSQICLYLFLLTSFLGRPACHKADVPGTSQQICLHPSERERERESGSKS